jgi:hypothetical protein
MGAKICRVQSINVLFNFNFLQNGKQIQAGGEWELNDEA